MKLKNKNFDRIRDYGEVKTRNNEIQNMINLVDHEVKRIDSRFLEPACGDGNFLSQILNNKVVGSKYSLKRTTT